MFSAMMPIVALSPSFGVFVAARAVLTFALNGEWSLGSMLVAETWRAHLRGRVISINRATWCFGASFAGAITGLVASTWGWRAAVMVPGVIALLAIYVRATCPESPWVRAHDRKRRIADTLAAGGTLSDEDRAWSTKADKVGIRQVIMPDVLPATLVATFVTRLVGHHWSVGDPARNQYIHRHSGAVEVFPYSHAQRRDFADVFCWT
jgi:MFS family permease